MVFGLGSRRHCFWAWQGTACLFGLAADGMIFWLGGGNPSFLALQRTALFLAWPRTVCFLGFEAWHCFWAYGGSGVKYTTGTSMAAPALAGAAAILRQYFQEGYCTSQQNCCGYRGCGTEINPSGSLLKAVLMNGANCSGNILDDQPLRAYDSYQGMGRVNLLNSVPMRGENTMQMKVVNDKWIVDGSKDIYKVTIDTSNECNRLLSVTLAWYGEFLLPR